MIARLRGKVYFLGEDFVIIDVNGVGYQVFCSSRTLDKLSLDSDIILEIETHVREDHIQLFGFSDMRERDWFKVLTVVQGVGAKVGLGILGSFSTEELIQVVSIGDKATLTRCPGIGPKLASRIIGELKDKVGKMLVPGQSVVGETNQISTEDKISFSVKEAASGLVNLGYNHSESLSAVLTITKKDKEEYSVENLIRLGLKELASNKIR